MRIFSILLICLMISACSTRLVSMPEPTQIPPTGERQITSVATVLPGAEELVSTAAADLASRLSIDTQEVRVISVESQLWPNSALGCPRPGEVYTQQTVLGYRIHFVADEQIYTYHTDTADILILCEEELPSFPVTPGEIDDGEPWMPVD